MISLSVYTYPAAAPGCGKRDLQLEAQPGSTVTEVLRSAAITTPDYYVIMVNGYGVQLDTIVRDGDQLVLFPAISGG